MADKNRFLNLFAAGLLGDQGAFRKREGASVPNRD